MTEPSLSIERYAEVLACLQHLGGRSRDEVLADFQLTADRWQLEADHWSNELMIDMDSGREDRMTAFDAKFAEVSEELQASPGSRRVPQDAAAPPAPAFSRAAEPVVNSPWLAAMAAAPPPSPSSPWAKAAATPAASPEVASPMPPSTPGSTGTRGVDPRWLGKSALPFQPNPKAIAAMMAERSEKKSIAPRPAPGATRGVDPRFLGMAAMPFEGDAPPISVEEVLDGELATVRPPAGGDKTQPPPPMPAHAAGLPMQWEQSPPSRASGASMTVEQSPPSRASGSSMTVEQYASFCAELAAFPADQLRIREKYRVSDDAAYRALVEDWQARMTQDTALHHHWYALVQHYQSWWRQSAR
jgi:hypothetical protein